MPYLPNQKVKKISVSLVKLGKLQFPLPIQTSGRLWGERLDDCGAQGGVLVSHSLGCHLQTGG
jgi:hypothetical protein